MFKKKTQDIVNNIDKSVNIDVFTKDNFYARLFRAFFVKMKSDKLYMLSFIITVLFLGAFSLYNIYESEGLYKVSKKEEEKIDVVDVTDELDISDYVGYYSKEYSLNRDIYYNESCSFDSYKIVYRIKSDNKILKYFVNDCVGTVLISSDSLSYLDDGSAKYVNANGRNYLFSATGMREIDGESYLIDKTIKSLKHDQNYGSSSVNFVNDDIIVSSVDNLYLIKKNKVDYVLSDDYILNTIFLDKSVYSSVEEDLTFKFIVFNKDLEFACYEEDYLISDSFVDGPSYTIYSISYNEKNGSFDKVKEIVSRTKSSGCIVFNSDLESLKK